MTLLDIQLTLSDIQLTLNDIPLTLFDIHNDLDIQMTLEFKCL